MQACQVAKQKHFDSKLPPIRWFKPGRKKTLGCVLINAFEPDSERHLKCKGPDSIGRADLPSGPLPCADPAPWTWTFQVDGLTSVFLSPVPPPPLQPSSVDLFVK